MRPRRGLHQRVVHEVARAERGPENGLVTVLDGRGQFLLHRVGIDPVDVDAPVVAHRSDDAVDLRIAIADIGQKPIDRQSAVEEARRIAAGGADPATESAVERLRRVAAASK